ncbi:MAG: hypothetical protein RIQ88_547 [Actinomycetota bacterium]|jgi:hypothetical protein
MSLTFGYSTLESRLAQLKPPVLDQHPDWKVLVTVQSGSASEPNLSAAPKGLEVYGFSGAGVTKIRNQAIKLAKTKYLIFADDDVTFDLVNIAKAIEYMQLNNTALLLGQTKDEANQLRKNYPTKITKLTKFNSAKAATYEMIVDLEQIKPKSIFFDENFGAGVAKTYLGDEYIFICDLLDANLNCVFYPITLAIHPKDSSGSKWGSNEDRVARALVFDRAFKGNFSLPYLARIGFGIKKIGKELTFVNFLKFVFKR